MRFVLPDIDEEDSWLQKDGDTHPTAQTIVEFLREFFESPLISLGTSAPKVS
jgi:hypothetical protein